MMGGVVLMVTMGIWLYSGLVKRTDSATIGSDLDKIRTHIKQGETSLAEGNFQSAVEEFNAVRAMNVERPGLLTGVEDRQLHQFLQQATLLADLLSESLEDVTRQMDGPGDKEAQIVFARRFKGKAVVFYSEVRRDASGDYHMDYRIRNGPREMKVDIGKLTLLHGLPLHDSHLLLFGARLMDMRREPAGSWLVLFEPESGVFITDRGAAHACCFGLADEGKLAGVLHQQAAWVAEIP
jgi:hypothetical protein